jgi:hypothetical protein
LADHRQLLLILFAICFLHNKNRDTKLLLAPLLTLESKVNSPKVGNPEYKMLRLSALIHHLAQKARIVRLKTEIDGRIISTHILHLQQSSQPAQM